MARLRVGWMPWFRPCDVVVQSERRSLMSPPGTTLDEEAPLLRGPCLATPSPSGGAGGRRAVALLPVHRRLGPRCAPSNRSLTNAARAKASTCYSSSAPAGSLVLRLTTRSSRRSITSRCSVRRRPSGPSGSRAPSARSPRAARCGRAKSDQCR